MVDGVEIKGDSTGGFADTDVENVKKMDGNKRVGNFGFDFLKEEIGNTLGFEVYKQKLVMRRLDLMEQVVAEPISLDDLGRERVMMGGLGDGLEVWPKDDEVLGFGRDLVTKATGDAVEKSLMGRALTAVVEGVRGEGKTGEKLESLSVHG